MNEDRIKGAAQELGGKAEKAMGKLTGDGETRAAGATNELEGAAQNLYGQAKDTVRRVAEDAPETIDEAYRQGRRYVTDGAEYAEQQFKEHPLGLILAAAGVGYLLAYLIHNRR